MNPIPTIVTLVNDAALYAACQVSFRGAARWIAIDADARGWNAAQGLNHGLAEAATEWIVCCHQDVRFPRNWWDRALSQLQDWHDRRGRDAAVAGLVGATRAGRYRGAVLDPHGWRRWSRAPSRIACLDEHVLILHRAAPLRFDESIPGFHGYGADIALTAAHRGLDAIAIDAPVLHLSPGRIDASWQRAAGRLTAKWSHRHGGVIPTCARTIVAPGLRSWPRRVQVHLMKRLSSALAQRGADPIALSSTLACVGSSEPRSERRAA